MANADRCVCCGEIVPEGRQVCPQCEHKRYIYTIPDIPPSLNKFAGRENVWAYRAGKKQWQALCAAYCRPKPSEPIKKCVVRITYFFAQGSGTTLTITTESLSLTACAKPE